MAVRSAPSELAHSNHRSHAACLSRRQPTRSSSLCEAQSLAQALKDRTQQRRISAALHADHRPAWKLDVDRTERRRLLLHTSFPYLRLTRSSYRDWKQSCGCCNRLRQLATLEGTPPGKYLVGVHPVCPRHQRHTRTRLKRQLDNAPLLCNRTKSANPAFRSFCLNHDQMVRLMPEMAPEGNFERLRKILIGVCLKLTMHNMTNNFAD